MKSSRIVLSGRPFVSIWQKKRQEIPLNLQTSVQPWQTIMWVVQMLQLDCQIYNRQPRDSLSAPAGLSSAGLNLDKELKLLWPTSMDCIMHFAPQRMLTEFWKCCMCFLPDNWTFVILLFIPSLTRFVLGTRSTVFKKKGALYFG